MKHVSTYKSFILLLLGSIIIVISTTSYADEKQTETFTPVFIGLTKGQYNKSSGCITVNNNSALLEAQDFEQVLKYYSGQSCKKANQKGSQTVSVETHIAGFWQNHLVLDEGTDANSRDLHLIDINNSKQKQTFSYQLQPVFKTDTLTWYSPLNKPVKPADCTSNSKAELSEWKRLHLEAELTEEKVFDLKTNKIGSTGKKKCVSVQ